MLVEKKKGSILIETMIFLALISVLIGLYYKSMIASVNKLSMYKIKEDIKTLDSCEVEISNSMEKAIKDDEKVYNIVTNYYKDKTLKYTYKTDLNSENYIKIDKGSMFLIRKYDSQNKIFRELKVNEVKKDNKESRDIQIYPTQFKIISRSENENGFNF